MKRFNDYTDTELLALDNETVNDAIRIEAIQQGVTPPIPLSEAIRKTEWRGYQKPAEAIPVYEICMSGKYNNLSCSGVGYLDEARAVNALDGLIQIEEVTYGNDKGTKIHQGTATIQKKMVGISKSEQAWAKLEAFNQDNAKFNEVSDVCIERLSKVRQADYERRVNAEKKIEYLRLAGGNEEIAKGFWSKVERTEWPS